jgi:hypothetical protein
VDFITRLLPSSPIGVTNYIVIIDRLTKSVILIRIKDTTVEDVVEVFLTQFYIYYSVLLLIVSDRGP